MIEAPIVIFRGLSRTFVRKLATRAPQGDQHRIGVEVVGRQPVVREPGLLAAAAARPSTVVFGEVAYPTLFGKAAALLFSVCQNHTLLDGNKRLAWAAAVTFLALNGHPVPEIDVDAAEAFMLSVADGTLTEVPQIEAGLRALYA